MTASLKASSDGTQAIIGVGGVDKIKIGPDTLAVTPTGGIGYGTGAGGTVTQLTSKSTTVTLNTPTGQITMNSAALAAGTAVYFTFNNSLITSTDTVLLTGVLGAATNYRIECAGVAAGVANIRVTNITGGSLSDAIIINFSIIKGVAS